MVVIALTIILIILIFLISAIPLHIAVRLLGGRTSIVWAAITNLVAGIVSAVIYVSLSRWGAVVAFVALLVVYKFMFSLSWIRSVLAWIMQGVIGFLIFLALVYLGAVPI